MANPCKEQTRLGFSRDLDNFLSTLFEIWGKLGMDDAQKKTRGEAARSHVKSLMQNMISEEENLMNRLAKTIAEFTEKLDQLCEELSLPHIKVSGIQPNKTFQIIYNLDFESISLALIIFCLYGQRFRFFFPF